MRFSSVQTLCKTQMSVCIITCNSSVSLLMVFLSSMSSHHWVCWLASPFRCNLDSFPIQRFLFVTKGQLHNSISDGWVPLWRSFSKSRRLLLHNCSLLVVIVLRLVHFLWRCSLSSHLHDLIFWLLASLWAFFPTRFVLYILLPVADGCGCLLALPAVLFCVSCIHITIFCHTAAAFLRSCSIAYPQKSHMFCASAPESNQWWWTDCGIVCVCVWVCLCVVCSRFGGGKKSSSCSRSRFLAVRRRKEREEFQFRFRLARLSFNFSCWVTGGSSSSSVRWDWERRGMLYISAVSEKLTFECFCHVLQCFWWSTLRLIFSSWVFSFSLFVFEFLLLSFGFVVLDFYNILEDPFSQCEQLQGITRKFTYRWKVNMWEHWRRLKLMTQSRKTSTPTCLIWTQTWSMCTLTRTILETRECFLFVRLQCLFSVVLVWFLAQTHWGASVSRLCFYSSCLIHTRWLTLSLRLLHPLHFRSLRHV